MSVSNGPNLHKMINALTGDSFASDFRTFLQMIDALVQCAVISKTVSTPPGSPANGDRYIVGPSPTGAWSGLAGKIVAWSTDDPGFPSGFWQNFVPNAGFLTFNVADTTFYFWNGSAWTALAGGGGGATAFTGLSDVPASYSGAGHQAVQVNAGATALEFVDKPADPMVYVPGAYTNSQVLFKGTPVRPWNFPSGLTGSVANLDVAATASTVFSLQKNGTQFGTITVAASGTTGTLAAGSATSFNGTTDVFSIVGPASADATAAGLSFTLKGVRV